MNVKINYLVVPITIAIATIITIILAATQQGWYYYLIGVLTALLNHGLRVKQNARLVRFAKLDPTGETLKPKRTAILWYLLRVVVFAGIFIVLIFKAEPWTNPQGIYYIITGLGGYATLTVALIITVLICRGKVKE